MAKASITCTCSGHQQAKWWIDNRFIVEFATEGNPLTAELIAKVKANHKSNV